MWVQVSGMIGANSKTRSPWDPQSGTRTKTSTVYQPDDAPRYYKANKGLLVICVWMCVSWLFHPCSYMPEAHARSQVVQYPGTFFYYRWRNNSKAKKWDAMTPEEQDHYRKTSSDEGNKR